MEFRFDLDPCPLARKPKDDGLAMDWRGRNVFCNPPYSEIGPWVEKAVRSAALTVFVLPARQNARWSHMLRDANAEFRIFRRGFDFRRIDGKRAHPLGGAMVVIVRRLDRL